MRLALRARLRAGVVVLSLAGGLAAALPATSGSASPSLTLSQVQSRIAALNTQAEKVTEAYDAATERLAALQAQAKTAGATLAADQAKLAQAKSALSAQVSLAYETGNTSELAAILSTGDPEQLVQSSADFSALTSYQAQRLLAAAVAERAVEGAQAAYSASVASEKATIAAVGAQKSQIQGLLAQENAVLAQLKASQRAALAAAQSAQTQQQTSLRASYAGPVSGRAGAAVRFAYAQLGKPYQYGATGPGSYDCSGLTMRAWQAAGVSLPRTAAEQQSALPYVSRGDLQPGDLVFFGSPAYHTAIYIGGGKIIQAPHTGASVEITPLSYMSDYSGAGRP